MSIKNFKLFVIFLFAFQIVISMESKQSCKWNINKEYSSIDKDLRNENSFFDTDTEKQSCKWHINGDYSSIDEYQDVGNNSSFDSNTKKQSCQWHINKESSAIEDTVYGYGNSFGLFSFYYAKKQISDWNIKESYNSIFRDKDFFESLRKEHYIKDLEDEQNDLPINLDFLNDSEEDEKISKTIQQNIGNPSKVHKYKIEKIIDLIDDPASYIPPKNNCIFSDIGIPIPIAIITQNLRLTRLNRYIGFPEDFVRHQQHINNKHSNPKEQAITYSDVKKEQPHHRNAIIGQSLNKIRRFWDRNIQEQKSQNQELATKELVKKELATKNTNNNQKNFKDNKIFHDKNTTIFQNNKVFQDKRTIMLQNNKVFHDKKTTIFQHNKVFRDKAIKNNKIFKEKEETISKHNNIWHSKAQTIQW